MRTLSLLLASLAMVFTLTVPAHARTPEPITATQHRHWAYRHNGNVGGCTVLHDHRTLYRYPDGHIVRGPWSDWRVTGTPYLSCPEYGALHPRWTPFTIKA